MKKRVTVLFLAIWSAALCLPLAVLRVFAPVGLVSYAAFNAIGEKRMPAPRPSVRKSSPRKVAWSDLGRGYEAWYNDAFPWRTEILRFHRHFSFGRLKTPVGREVPGHGNWIFRRGGDWAELDDYLGAFELTDDELANWIALFEGRREWAQAIGSVFLTLPAPVKAQVCWQKMFPALRDHRGRNVAAQVREALAGSPAREDVLFANTDFDDAITAGREVFFDSDHHPSAYGLWILYDKLNQRLAELFPGRVAAHLPWYDKPPQSVRDSLEPGCWPDGEGDQSDALREIRMSVSFPGEVRDFDGVPKGPKRYPYCNIATKREGGGISVLSAHDSYMRYTLSSWRGREDSVRFPFSKGVGSVRAFIFYRFSPGSLDGLTAESVPDVIVEQFPECRLDGSARKYLDDNTRAAAVFGRAAEPASGRSLRQGDRVAARAVLEDVRPLGKGTPAAVLKCGNKELGRRNVSAGVRRAVFFDGVDMPDGELSITLEACTAAATNLSWRLIAPDSI